MLSVCIVVITDNDAIIRKTRKKYIVKDAITEGRIKGAVPVAKRR